MSDTVLITADRALTGDAVRGPTSILAVDGEIVCVGNPDEVAGDARAKTARKIDWSRRAVVPGTVNTHNHSFQSLLRGIGDDLPFPLPADRLTYTHPEPDGEPAQGPTSHPAH